MNKTHILTDDTLRYIAEEETSHIQGIARNIALNTALGAMSRVREHYEKVFFWNEARLFRRIAELELKLAQHNAAPDAAKE